MFKLTKIRFEFDKLRSELISDFLSGIGAISVAEDFIDEAKVDICAYFPESSDLSEIRYRINNYVNFLTEEYGKLLLGTIESEQIDETSWQAWRDILKTVRVTDKILIKPPWEEYLPKENEYVIEINPSMAFGTGHHESTRLCIKAAQDIFQQQNVSAVLDIGCGSGVLSIAALFLGAKSIVAFDVDPVSVEETYKNLDKNKVSTNINVRCCDLKSIEGQYDLILANIYVEPLLNMRDGIKSRLKNSGKAVLSGFQSVRRDEIVEGFQSSGFYLVDEYTENDWVAVVLNVN
jgi:ribosomal protein L11 methyltransferase